MSMDTFMSKLPPAFAKKVRMAREVETHRLPLYSKGLTEALGGGIARGRICLIHGDTSAGKSALVFQSIGQWQKQGLICGFVDVEGTFDREWATSLGVDVDSLILQQTAKSSGKVEADTLPFIKAGIDVLVIDSISDIAPEAFTDDEGNLLPQDKRKQIGAHAKAITMLINAIHYYNENTAIILISQDTSNLGGQHVEMVPHGGKKTLFNSSQVIRLKSSKGDDNHIKGTVMVGGNPVERFIGRKVTYIVVKNKLGPPKGSGQWRFYYDGDFVGIDAAHEMWALGLDCGVVEKRGGWYSFDGRQIQGERNFCDTLREDSEFFNKLTAAVEAKYHSKEDSVDED